MPRETGSDDNRNDAGVVELARVPGCAGKSREIDGLKGAGGVGIRIDKHHLELLADGRVEAVFKGEFQCSFVTEDRPDLAFARSLCRAERKARRHCPCHTGGEIPG